jgi:Domain of unknown function (DUF3844)
MKLFSEKFGEASSLYDLRVREDRYFISEILALDSLIAHFDDIPLFANQLIMINIASLDGIYHKHGSRSSQYHTALTLFTSLINTLQTYLSSQHIVTITTIPPSTHHQKVSSLSARQLETSFGNEHSSPVLSMKQDNQHSIFGICHDSEAICVSATNNCSSHGSCVESIASNGCWACMCKPSIQQVGNGGTQTTYWAGEQCEKIDISTPFHLFFWVLFLRNVSLIC